MPAICPSDRSAYDFCGWGFAAAAFGFAGGAGGAADGFGLTCDRAATALAASRSAPLTSAKAWRSGSFRVTDLGASTDAVASCSTVSRSCLASRFETGLLATTAVGRSASAACMPPRERMLVTAAPATRKQVSARIVNALVKSFSPKPASCRRPTTQDLAPESAGLWGLIKALPCHRRGCYVMSRHRSPAGPRNKLTCPAAKTSGGAKLVGVLDVGDDIGGFPEGAG